MPRTRVKICGIMRPQDALLAGHAGADAIGMVFYPKARRCISIEQAGQILHTLPAFVTPVALFVDQEIDEIKRIASSLHIRHIQLHGRETPEIVAALRPFTILKAIRTDRDTLAAELQMWREAVESLDLKHLAALIMESPGASGGSGIENDWEAIADAQTRGLFAGLPPIIAAGGLDSNNVAHVVRKLNPFAVDVSSGVEETFGEKSPQKVRDFILNARTARAS